MVKTDLRRNEDLLLSQKSSGGGGCVAAGRKHCPNQSEPGNHPILQWKSRSISVFLILELLLDFVDLRADDDLAVGLVGEPAEVVLMFALGFVEFLQRNN